MRWKKRRRWRRARPTRCWWTARRGARACSAPAAARGPFARTTAASRARCAWSWSRSSRRGKLPALIGTSSLELGIDIGAVDAGAAAPIAPQRRAWPAARRALGPSGGPDQRGAHLCHLPRRSARRRRGGPRHDARRHRADLHAAATAWTCWPNRSWPWWQYETLAVDTVFAHGCARPMAIRSLTREALDRRAQDAQRRLSQRRLSRAAPAHRVGSRQSTCFCRCPARACWRSATAAPSPTRAQFRVYLPDGKTILGTLDEEFVFETRVGDVFTLGSNTWRVTEINEDRLIVVDAAGTCRACPFGTARLRTRLSHGPAPGRLSPRAGRARLPSCSGRPKPRRRVAGGSRAAR